MVIHFSLVGWMSLSAVRPLRCIVLAIPVGAYVPDPQLVVAGADAETIVTTEGHEARTLQMAQEWLDTRMLMLMGVCPRIAQIVLDVGAGLRLCDDDGLAKASCKRGQEKSGRHEIQFRFHGNRFRFSLDAA